MSSTKITKTSPNATRATTSNSSPSSYSAEKIADNGDLLNEILLRLPIKSLIKFKSVSKHWLSLISNPNFSSQRTPFPTSASSLFFVNPSGSRWAGSEFDFIDLNHNSNTSPPPFTSLTFTNDRPGIRVVQSCNGLLLCCTSQAFRPTTNYYVFNPTTKHYTVLPRLLFPRGTFGALCGVTLAFDPSKSPHYKVICIRNFAASRGQFQIEIYSSETGPWRTSSLGSFAADFSSQFGGSVFCNGAIHWFCPFGTSLCFKVDEERLFEMPTLPVRDDHIPDYRRFAYFGESRDHLHVIDYIEKPGEIRLNVYEMERDFSGWFVKYRVDLSQVSTAFPEVLPSSLFHQLTLHYHLFSVLCVVRSELDEDSCLVFNAPGKILRYNFKSKTLINLCDIEPTDPEIPETSLVPYVYQYIESLACV